MTKCKAFNVVVTTNFNDLVHDALLYSAQRKRSRVISHHPDSETGLLGFMRFEKVLDKISKEMNEEIKTTVFINDINPKKTKLDDLIDYIEDNRHFSLFDTALRRRANYVKALDQVYSWQYKTDERRWITVKCTFNTQNMYLHSLLYCFKDNC